MLNQLSKRSNGTLANFGLSASSSNWVESYAMVVPTATAASNITSSSFTANWTAPSVGTVDNGYKLDVSTNSAFSSFVSGYNGLNVSGTSKSVTGLTSGTSYYYRVRADKTSVTGQGAYSNVISTATCTSTSSSSSQNVCSNQLPYSWNGLTFTGTGTQTKTGLVNSVGCDSSATLTLTVGSPVTPTISITTTTDTVCSGNNVTFIATGVNAGTAPVYNWKKNGNSVGSGSSITFPGGTLANGDVISCVLTANNACQTTATAISNSHTMYVKTSPAIGTTTGLTTCNIGSIIGIYNTNPQDGGVWSSSNAAVATVTTSSNGSTGLVVPVANGTAVLTFTKISSNGCVSSASGNVIVAVAAAPNAITGTNSICKGNTTQLSSTTTGGVWSISPTSYASINSTGLVTSTSTGSAIAKYTVTNANGCSASTTYTVTVNAIPLIPTIGYQTGTVNPQTGVGGAFCANRTFTVVGSPSGGVWSKTGVISVTSPTGVVSTGSVAGAGSLTYTYTNSNGCSSSRTIMGNVVVCASRGVNGATNEKQEMRNEFTMYPNPAKTFISLSVNSLIGTGTIVFTDLYGKQVKIQALSLGNSIVDIASLTKGIYFVSMITSEGKTTKKLVVE